MKAWAAILAVGAILAGAVYLDAQGADRNSSQAEGASSSVQVGLGNIWRGQELDGQMNSVEVTCKDNEIVGINEGGLVTGRVNAEQPCGLNWYVRGPNWIGWTDRFVLQADGALILEGIEGLPATVTWVLLEDRENGEDVLVAVTHLVPGAFTKYPKRRWLWESQNAELVRWLETWDVSRVIVMGDFNNPNDWTIEADGFVDTETPETHEVGRLDRIFVRGGVGSAAQTRQSSSDHLALETKVEFR